MLSKPLKLAFRKFWLPSFCFITILFGFSWLPAVMSCLLAYYHQDSWPYQLALCKFWFQVKQKSLRQVIGVVPQDTVLFNNDIRYGLVWRSIIWHSTSVRSNKCLLLIKIMLTNIQIHIDLILKASWRGSREKKETSYRLILACICLVILNIGSIWPECIDRPEKNQKINC